jgi:starch synthase (maltosyl-transferring)
MSHGVRIFRVDNPHTKPVEFWAWLFAEVRRTDPDVLFLAEAFTKPAMMHALAKIGFGQSYTYFTWRNSKQELYEYFTELRNSAAYMRPNIFVNTPDILHAYLQHGGPAAFKVRAVLAAMLSPSWGVYSGYELFEHQALRSGSEEYLDSEKYQYKPRDWSQPSLAPYLTRLNEIRRAHPALHWLRNLRFHLVDSPDVLAFSKRTGEDVVLVVVNLNPHEARETFVHLWMPALGLEWDSGAFDVFDELTGQAWTWHGASNWTRLDPQVEPAHVLHVRPR